eukprot:1152834_1
MANHSHSYSQSCNSSVSALSEEFERACTRPVTECYALKRIIHALEWHATMHDGDTCDEVRVNEVLDDYIHMLTNHLSELDAIRAQVEQYIARCNPGKCAAHTRYVKLSSNELSHCDGTQFFLQLLDLIHCYIFHTKCFD